MSDPSLDDLGRRGLIAGGLGLAALAVLPGLTACTHGSGAAAGDPSAFALSTITGGAPAAVPETVGPLALGPGLHTVPVSVTRLRLGLTDVPDLSEVVDGMRSFGVRLHAASATVEKNWTSSPFSVAVAFGMLRAGARGVSAKEVDTVFGFPRSVDADGLPHAAFNALTDAMVTAGPVGARAITQDKYGRTHKPVLAVSNGLFVDSQFAPSMRRHYVDLLTAQYGVEVNTLRFDDKALALMNTWASDQTRGRIKRLFDQLDPAAVVVLANAVYLMAAWASPFDSFATRARVFSTPNGGARVPMMKQTESWKYGEGDGWQRVTVPYNGQGLTMRVVAPRAVVRDVAGLTDAVRRAVEPTVTDTVATVDLQLPRWDAVTNIDLQPPMQRLGVRDVFSESMADLSGLATQSTFVGAAVHRANITVGEDGTEAAAITALEVFSVSARAFVGKQVVVKADRPFAWAIVHEPTGTPCSRVMSSTRRRKAERPDRPAAQRGRYEPTVQ